MKAEKKSASEEVLTAKEVAARLRTTTKNVYELARNELIPCQRVGKEWRFYWPVIQQWLAGAKGRVALKEVSYERKT